MWGAVPMGRHMASIQTMSLCFAKSLNSEFRGTNGFSSTGKLKPLATANTSVYYGTRQGHGMPSSPSGVTLMSVNPRLTRDQYSYLGGERLSSASESVHCGMCRHKCDSKKGSTPGHNRVTTRLARARCSESGGKVRVDLTLYTYPQRSIEILSLMVPVARSPEVNKVNRRIFPMLDTYGRPESYEALMRAFVPHKLQRAKLPFFGVRF